MEQTKSQSYPKYVTIFLFFFAALIGSCKKDKNAFQNYHIFKPSTFSNKKDAKEYVNKQLKIYAIVFAELTKNPAVVNLVHELVAEKFDGDDNVLIKTLIERATEKGIDLKKMFSDILDKKEIKISVDELLISFNDLNHKNIYPHIYIPNFEKFNNQIDLIELNKKNDNVIIGQFETASLNDRKLGVMPLDYNSLEYPIIVPYDGDESVIQQYYMGYSYTNNGTLINDINVDEEFANQYETWVITPNERVDINGNVPTIYNGPTPAGPISPTGADAYIPSMVIKTHKEPWIKGASEITMQYSFSWFDKINPANGQAEITHFQPITTNAAMTNPYVSSISLVILGQSDIIWMPKFKRDDINRKKEVYINFTYAPLSKKFESFEYFYPYKGDYIYLVIYEDDTFLTSPHQLDYEGVPFNISSNDEPYLLTKVQIAPKNQPIVGQTTSSANIDNDVITFRSRHK